jgi:hypothetical protein
MQKLRGRQTEERDKNKRKRSLPETEEGNYSGVTK